MSWFGCYYLITVDYGIYQSRICNMNFVWGLCNGNMKRLKNITYNLSDFFGNSTNNHHVGKIKFFLEILLLRLLLISITNLHFNKMSFPHYLSNHWKPDIGASLVFTPKYIKSNPKVMSAPLNHSYITNTYLSKSKIRMEHMQQTGWNKQIVAICTKYGRYLM